MCVYTFSSEKRLTVYVDDVAVLLGLAWEVFINCPACQVLAVVLGQGHETNFGGGQHRVTVIVDGHVLVTEKN